jgi:predicted DsbA family dithiol-disulfide isomerase
MEQRPDHPLTVEWHPFQLNPDMPAEGMDRRAYLEHKFGGREGAIRAYAPVVEHGETAGLSLQLETMSRTPNTINAHRLIHWAGIEGRQTPVVAALFKAYFVDGRDIGDTATLADIAGAAGMDRAMTETLLQGDADADDIRARDAHTRQRGVSGVPTFIVAQQHALSGAQPTDLWLNVIDELSQQIAAQS